jgi:hypothetical protein
LLRRQWDIELKIPNGPVPLFLVQYEVPEEDQQNHKYALLCFTYLILPFSNIRLWCNRAHIDFAFDENMSREIPPYHAGVFSTQNEKRVID